MTASDSAPTVPPSGDLPQPPVLQVAIHILADGRVVFGDLPPGLAEVAHIVAGTRASDRVDVGSLEGAR